MSDENPSPSPESAEPVEPAASEQPAEPDAEPASEAAAAPAAEPASEPAPVRSRRVPALAVAAALVAVAACGGLGYAVLHGGQGTVAAKPAATPWSSPAPTATKAFGARSGGSHYGSPRLLLLPVPTGYRPGPDVEGYGNDVALGAEQARQLVRGDSQDLSAKERKELDEAVDALHIESAGMRTYLEDGGDLEVQIRIVQMKNKEAAKAQTEYFTAFTKALGVFRTGPKVKGYPKATCVLPPIDKDEKLDGMTCQATEGDLMVTMSADGTRPLAKSAAADLLRRQLDRIKDPGTTI
ncbi:hypothetical protein [Streptomyces sp. CA2R106]|uniref:hypothetical protein n=1 Tax=Streptomyces sp. CA2R106 TaxID=3120153 RepID=UPI00300B2586